MAVHPRSFPPGAAECRPGDHLVRGEPNGQSRVYRVRDIVALERLMPSLTRPIGLTAEADLLDSMAPAYAGEVYLLLDALEPAFGTADEALRAVREGGLKAHAGNLLQPAADFPADRTQVVAGSSAGGDPA